MLPNSTALTESAKGDERVASPSAARALSSVAAVAEQPPLAVLVDSTLAELGLPDSTA
jgi:hypothetical protein